MVQRHDFTVDAAFKNKKWADYKKGFGEMGEHRLEQTFLINYFQEKILMA